MASRYFWLLAFGVVALGFLAVIASNMLKPTSRPKNIQKRHEQPVQSADPLPSALTQKMHKKPKDRKASAKVAPPSLLKLDMNLPQPRPQTQSPPPETQVAQEAIPEKRCFKIEHPVLEVPEGLPEHIRVAGASSLPLDRFRFVQDELDTHAGQCIGHDELNQILKDLTARIFEKGYTTTRLGIPEQNLSTGTLRVNLFPGLIHAIRFEPEDARVSWKTASVARAGDVLNLRDIEQGLEQMKRVPSQDMEMQIVPAGNPGESDIVINIKQNKSWKWIATVDDSGASSTGKLQASLNLAIDNLFGINDLFNAGINTDAENRGSNRGTRGNNAYYSMPYGNWLFTLSGSNYQYHQRIAGTYQTFVSSGETNNLELKISYLLHRDQNSKSSLQVRSIKRWNSSFIDDTEIAVQRRNNTIAEIALVHKQSIGQMQLEITAAQRAGVHWFGAQQDLEGRLATDPTFFYEMSILDANLSIPFSVANRAFKSNHSLHAQSTESSLYASEYISIGSRWSVRGFDGESSLAAERGWFIRNEFEMPFPETNQAIYIGLDMGRVYGDNVANLVGDHLVGAALGLRGSLFTGMYYDLFTGWPLYKPEQYPTTVPAAGFSLTYQF